MRIPTLATLFTALPALAIAQGYSGHMLDYGYGYGMMFGPVLWLIVLGLIVAGVIWFVRRTDAGQGTGASRALSELDLRFARGEIDAEDYAARKKLLTE
jgi:putative membrane protein